MRHQAVSPGSTNGLWQLNTFIKIQPPWETVRLQDWFKGSCWVSLLDFWTVFSLLIKVVWL